MDTVDNLVNKAIEARVTDDLTNAHLDVDACTVTDEADSNMVGTGATVREAFCDLASQLLDQYGYYD